MTHQDIPEKRRELLERKKTLNGQKEEVTWTCLSTSPEGRAGVLAAETQTSVMDDIFIPKSSAVMRCPEQVAFQLQ